VTLSDLIQSLDADAVGREIYALAAEMYPYCRSITGDGLRQTLRTIQKHIPVVLNEVPSGTQVFDWTVPNEWNIRDAFIRNAWGERVVDFRRHNLHVMSYSVPVNRRMTLAELRPHLHTLPDRPDWIPYRTSYYKETWGFCLAHRDFQQLDEGDYEVWIDSTLAPGSLTFGETYLPGDTAEEVLISCHCCHPSLANDNLSAISLATALAKRLREVRHRYSYRFLFIPGTIGSITWLALNEDKTKGIRHGLVLSCLGDAGGFTYKKSRRGDAEIDRAAQHVLRRGAAPHRILDFIPWGYDERQYCSPGFDLAVGCLMRSQNGTFPEYHTSADNLDFIQPSFLGDSFTRVLSVIEVLEGNGTWVNQSPKCEPRLGARGLYPSMGGRDASLEQLALLWVLNLCDGRHDLLSIAERAGLPFAAVSKAAEALGRVGLLGRPGDRPPP
jgi:aminopeptidase-like protein